MINYVCRCNNAICTYKSANAGFMYVQAGKKKQQVNRKGNRNEQTNEHTNKRFRRLLKTLKYIQGVNEKSN